MLVYIFILKFGVNNGLAVIQAVVTGEHIAGSCGDEKIIGIVKAEQFEGNEHGGNGTVGNAAEHGDHAYRRAQGCRKPQKGAYSAAEGGTDEQGGYDFTALIAGGNRDDRKYHFEKKSPWQRIACQRLFNDRHARAKVILAPDKEGEENEKDAARADPDIQVTKIFLKKNRTTFSPGTRESSRSFIT